MTLGLRGTRARQLTLLAAAVVLAGAVLLLRGGGRPERRLSVSASTAGVGVAEQRPAAAPVADAPVAEAPVAEAIAAKPVAGPVEQEAVASAGAAAVLPADEAERVAAFATGRPDRRALDLIVGIERQLQSEAPPEVHELLSAWRRGATRQELLERTRRDLPPSFALRALVVRWINEVAPDPDRPAPVPAASRLAQQQGRWLAPIRPVAAP